MHAEGRCHGVDFFGGGFVRFFDGGEWKSDRNGWRGWKSDYVLEGITGRFCYFQKFGLREVRINN